MEQQLNRTQFMLTLKCLALSVLSFFWTVLYVVASPLNEFRDCDVCPVMIELPLGEFVMGQRPGEVRRKVRLTIDGPKPVSPDDPVVKNDEGPLHHVEIDIPIAIGKNEVTFEEWNACVADGGCGGYSPSGFIGLMRPEGGSTTLGSRHPVIQVSFADILAYVDWLNNKTNSNSYRLPTEAEWEYAARAGTTSRFAQGDNLTSEQANFSGDVTEQVTLTKRPELVTRGAPVKVDELDAANAWGLRHMSGNVSEYTLSCYTNRYLGWKTSSEWLAQSTLSDTCIPTTRGGSYACPMDCVRVAWRRKRENYDFRGDLTGFRVVKELTDAQ